MSKKRKANLTTQSRRWFITIRKNIDLPINELKKWCEYFAQSEMYAFIEHKGDISPDSGEVEGVHYHIVINMINRHQKIHILNDLVKTFNFSNAFGIEVDTYDTFEGCLQYLTHQNEPKKTPHERSEIITNIESDTFNSILDTPLATSLTSTSLVGYIKQCNNAVELMTLLGLGTFDHYLKTIRVIWKLIKGTNIEE